MQYSSPATYTNINPSSFGWDYFFSNANEYATPDGCGLIKCTLNNPTDNALYLSSDIPEI